MIPRKFKGLTFAKKCKPQHALSVFITSMFPLSHKRLNVQACAPHVLSVVIEFEPEALVQEMYYSSTINIRALEI